jgi:hypothetical protein
VEAPDERLMGQKTIGRYCHQQVDQKVDRAAVPARATSFNFTEQNIMQKIVTESCPQHFAAQSKPFFRNTRLLQQI